MRDRRSSRLGRNPEAALLRRRRSEGRGAASADFSQHTLRPRARRLRDAFPHADRRRAYAGLSIQVPPDRRGKPAAENGDPPMTVVPTKDERGEFHMNDFTSQDHMASETQGPLAARPAEHSGEQDG